MELMDRLYEHLITKTKYNTLENKYETLRLEMDRKGYELTLEKRVREKQQNLFNDRLNELINENIKLREDIAKLRKENRRVKKNDKNRES